VTLGIGAGYAALWSQTNWTQMENSATWSTDALRDQSGHGIYMKVELGPMIMITDRLGIYLSELFTTSLTLLRSSATGYWLPLHRH
jgi:hypothetical protein